MSAKTVPVTTKESENSSEVHRGITIGTNGGLAEPAKPDQRIRLLGILHILIALLLFYLLFEVWPARPWPTDEKSAELTLDLMFFDKVETSLDERLIFLVIVAGAIGSYVQSATSFATYVGNRQFVSSWFWWYILRPFIGISLALVLYFVVRAGFLTGGTGQVNPYVVATLGALAGLFSKQATDKLEEVFATVFRPAPGKGDDKRKDKLVAPAITSLTPNKGPASGGTEVTIMGAGFVDKPSVTFGDKSATVIFDNATKIRATTPDHAPGIVDVIVKNPDGQQVGMKQIFAYEGPTLDNETVETIDGCDTDIIDETSDEDLPITTGGVA